MDSPDEVDGWPVMTPVLESPKPVEGGEGRIGSSLSWTIVYTLDLPVCLYFGLGFTPEEGKLGILAGIILLYLVGLGLLRAARPFGVDLIVGGAVAIFSQFVPLAQILAGAAGLWLAEIIHGAGTTWNAGPEGVSFPAALIATLVTGGLLMTLALLIGLLSRLVTPADCRKPDPGRAKPMTLAEFRDF